jgi:hypothetical protein
MNYLFLFLYGFAFLAFTNFLIFFQSGPTFNRPLRIIEAKTKGGSIKYRIQQRDWLGIWTSCYMPDPFGLTLTEFDSIDKAEKYIQAELKYRKSIDDSKIASNRVIKKYE